jgi:hypothetical protein
MPVYEALPSGACPPDHDADFDAAWTENDGDYSYWERLYLLLFDEDTEVSTEAHQRTLSLMRVALYEWLDDLYDDPEFEDFESESDSAESTADASGDEGGAAHERPPPG